MMSLYKISCDVISDNYDVSIINVTNIEEVNLMDYSEYDRKRIRFAISDDGLFGIPHGYKYHYKNRLVIIDLNYQCNKIVSRYSRIRKEIVKHFRN